MSLADGTINETLQPLKILVVGAGIGGLAAATALRHQGHNVVLFEQSRFANELGAAIHLAPNATGLVKRLGIDPESFGSVETRIVTTRRPDGTTVHSVPAYKFKSAWQHKWLLSHRVHLHEALKKAATGSAGKGKPCEIRTSNRVIDVNCETATITFEDGTESSGDLIIGADGVRSVCRTKVSSFHAAPSGKSAFRFLLDREAALQDPTTRHHVEEDGELVMWIGEDRRVIMYPTSFGNVLNFVCIHPAEETNASTEDWSQGGNKKQLISLYKNFAPEVQALLEKADPETLRLWQLLDMEPLETWTRSRMALLGDAAHPFLPHQGQGGGVAIEDALSLAALLPLGTTINDLKDRLGLYQECRVERANKIQHFTRLVGMDLRDRKEPLDMNAYTNYNFGHDEWDFSSQKLREWHWSRNSKFQRQMPIQFGPAIHSYQGSVNKTGSAAEFVTASVKFKTSRTFLQYLLPTSYFSFQAPGTMAIATFSATKRNGVKWLGGRSYTNFGLYVHGVQYKKADGTYIKGTYVPVIFADAVEAVIAGREQQGFPKLHCDLDLNSSNGSCNIRASWRGQEFVSIQWQDLSEAVCEKVNGGVKVAPNSFVPAHIGATGPSGPPSPLHSPPPIVDDGILAYKYVPASGISGWAARADVEYPVFAPYVSQSEKERSIITERASRASVTFKEGIAEKDLPTLYHIVERLAELPVKEILEAKVTKGTELPEPKAFRVE